MRSKPIPVHANHDESARRFSRKKILAYWIFPFFLVLLVGGLYREVGPVLVRSWFTDDDSYGLILLAWAGYAAFTRRHRLSVIHPALWWPGIGIMLLAFILYFTGQLVAEYYSQQISLVFMIAGIVSFLIGKKVLKSIMFPMFLLFLSIPLPSVVVNHFTFPLKFVVSFFSANILDLMGIPVFREGNILHLPGMTLEVVNACSGIRSIFALTLIGLVMSTDLHPVWRKIALLLSILPLAVLTNALRITVSGVAHGIGFSRISFHLYHGFSGWLFFMLALFLLWILKNLISRNSSPSDDLTGCS